MKKIKVTILSTVSFLLFWMADALKLTLPSDNQAVWNESEMGAIFHYDLHVFDGERYVQALNRKIPIDDPNIFAPDSLDTDQWIRAAKAAGCRFALLTATHETGFGLWQSDINPYCMKMLRWKEGRGDIVESFVNSCRKYDILPGLYIGIRWNSFLGIKNFSAGDNSARQQWYRHYCEEMTRELCSRYGELFMVWFDGGADDPRGDGPDVEPIVSQYQPDCLFYHNVDRADLRWGGSESGKMSYPCWSTFPVPYSHNKSNESAEAHLELLRHGDPDGEYWVPAMADFPLRSGAGRHEWFWEPGDEESLLSLDELLSIYENSVGRNATMIVGLTPDPHGLLPREDVERLTQWGSEIDRLYADPVASSSAEGKDIVLNLHGKREISRCVIREDIRQGERIRKYRVEALVNGRWVALCDGESVGNKRIQRFSPVVSSRIRLKVTSSVATPVIREFSVF